MRVPVEGGSIHCDVHGEGEPLLWVHGFMGSGGDWAHIFGACPDGMRLIAPDLVRTLVVFGDRDPLETGIPDPTHLTPMGRQAPPSQP